ncbi:MAG: response regulator transcription factor [Chitinophagaceae bacterium]
MRYSIVIADDHILIAKALAVIIDTFNKYEVLYEVANGKELMEQFSNKKRIPDIVLLDITMPEMDGFETAKWLTKEHPGILILALSMQNDEQTLIRMMKAGARGYLVKNVHPAELEKALDSLVTKGVHYSDLQLSKVLSHLTREDDPKDSTLGLSEREKEFLRYAATELTYKEIGGKMFCSSRTVESYRDSLFEKLHLKTRVGLVVYAIRHGLIKV